jgi:acyl-CoA synthetase (AMP-forming)/AMP-acid ligase II/aryl carrier-like protein
MVSSNELSEVDGAPFQLEGLPSLWALFNRSIQEYPDDCAFAATHQPPDLYGIPSLPLGDAKYQQRPYLRWTYKNLKDAIDRFADGLKSKGVTKGTPVIAFMQNSAEVILTLWASLKLGAIFVPINPRNLSNEAEVTQMISTAISTGTSGRSVFVANSAEVAKQIDNSGLPGKEALKIAVAESDAPTGWMLFKNFISAKIQRNGVANGHVVHGSEETSTDDMIFFTSGTTSLPKGVLWSYPTMATSLALRARDADSMKNGSATAVVVPNNHGIGNIFILTALCNGSKLVFPGPVFEPQKFMDALQREEITHVSLVPTIVHALIGRRGANEKKLDSLVSVMLGGSMVTPELLRQCTEELGSRGCENGYGMTEGVLNCSGNFRDISKLIKDGKVTVGTVYPGCHLKICEPGSTDPVPRGTIGELHFSGLMLSTGYIGRKSEDHYVGRDGKRWFKTGDMATIDSDAWVFIVGRYKDMIIRGAENISPAAIEAAINRNQNLENLDAQVVGVSDSIAGEVPVAVVKGDVTAEVAKDLQEAVLKRMGTIYVPEEVVSLKSLGVADFPRTMAGKVQKTKLVDLVRKYRHKRDGPAANGAASQLTSEVRRIWSRAVGLKDDQVDLNAPVAEFADSITIMRVRDKIRRDTGKSLSLTEMADAGTIASQIKLLERQAPAKGQKTKLQKPKRDGPPTLDDMVHVSGNEDIFQSTKSFIEEKLKAFDLTWDDVEDVFPTYDWNTVAAESGIYKTWNFQMAIMPKNVDKRVSRPAPKYCSFTKQPQASPSFNGNCATKQPHHDLLSILG